jgi:hypothetical protein
MTDFNEVHRAPPRAWRVVLTVTDTPAARETYLTKDEITRIVSTISLEAGVDYEVRVVEIVEPAPKKVAVRPTTK